MNREAMDEPAGVSASARAPAIGPIFLWLLGTLSILLLAWHYARANDVPPGVGFPLFFLSQGCWVLWLLYTHRHPFDLLDPVHLVTALLVFGFWSSLVLNPGFTGLPAGISQKTLLIAVLATLAFLAGYNLELAGRMARRLPVPKFLKMQARPGVLLWLLELWAVTVVFRLYFSLSRGYGTAVMFVNNGSPFNNLVQLIGGIGPYFLYMAVFIILPRRIPGSRFFLMFLLSGFCVEAWLAFIAGWKAGMAVVLYGLLFVIRCLFPRFRRALIMGLMFALAGVLALVVTYRAVNAYREQVIGKGVDTRELISSMRDSIHSAGDRQNLKSLASRLDYGTMLGRAVEAMDNQTVAFQRGRTLWPALLWFVPRALWPTKPTLSIGAWYAQTVLGWQADGSEGAATLPGEFYMNFGIPGVFLGMLLYGLGLRMAYEYFVRRIGPPGGVWVFIPIFLIFGVTIERNLAAIVGHGMQTAIVVAVFAWFFLRHGGGLPALRTQE
ncbi:MAG: hypothetical protein PHX45_05220 [Acidobacteriota bacterium]|nr:hypothetical protein [Acidobacteriota bacterium]